MKKDDVILLTDGRMLMIVGDGFFEDYKLVQFLTETVTSHVDMSRVHIDKNLGQSKEVTASFVSAHSIHVRLNNIKAL